MEKKENNNYMKKKKYQEIEYLMVLSDLFQLWMVQNLQEQTLFCELLRFC